MSRVATLGLFATLAPRADAAEPGKHIRAGTATVITPSLQTGVEIHSNIYLAADAEDQVAAPFWVLHPKVLVEYKNRWVGLSLGGGYSLKKYFDLKPEDKVVVTNLDRFGDFDTYGQLVGLSDRLLGFTLSDNFAVQSTPAELPTTDEPASIVRRSNDLEAGLQIRPGSALELTVGGRLGTDAYIIPEALIEQDDQKFNNRTSFGPGVAGTWRFLPKTALVGSASLNFSRWEDNLIYAIGPDIENTSYGSFIGKPDSVAWRTRWGIRGQFTPKLAVGVEIGYGQMTYDEQSVLDQADGVAGEELSYTGLEESFARDLTSFGEGSLVVIQGQYAPIRGHTATVGYRKDFQDATFTNYTNYHDFFLRYEGLYFSHLDTTAEFTFRRDAYHGEIAREDDTIKVKVGGAWKFSEWFSASLGGGWAERACADENCNNAAFYGIQYDDFWAQGGVTFTY